MLKVIVNKSWGQHPIKQKLYGHLPPIKKTIQIRQARRADTVGKLRTNSKAMYSYGTLHMNEQRQNDQQEPIYKNTVLIQDIALKTSREWWMIETGSGQDSDRSVLAAWHNDDKILVDWLSCFSAYQLFFGSFNAKLSHFNKSSKQFSLAQIYFFITQIYTSKQFDFKQFSLAWLHR